MTDEHDETTGHAHRWRYSERHDFFVCVICYQVDDADDGSERST